MELIVPDFWDKHRSPPDYRCDQAGPACLPLGPSEWTCGPFSMVRAMRRLAALLEAAGLPEIAALCATKSPGYVEAMINQALSTVEYAKNPTCWVQIDALKQKARNIRKWGIEP